jgi:hypothetical protein
LYRSVSICRFENTPLGWPNPPEPRPKSQAG